MESVIYKARELVALAAEIAHAQKMVAEDAAKHHDEGTSVLGAGIAVRFQPPRCHKPVRKILIDAPFQGNVGSKKACTRALEFLRAKGIEVFWYDGAMD